MVKAAMNNVLRVAIVDPNDASRETLKYMLLGMDMIWLEAECSKYEFFSDVVGQTQPDIGVVVLDDNSEKALDMVATLVRRIPKCSVLVISNSNDGDLILRSMRAGAVEFLTQPVEIDDIVHALGRISDQKYGQDEASSRGCSTIAVAGATGGVGCTSIAVNLGCTLASDPNHSVVLLDMDLSLGDADVLLDTIPEYTLVDVAENISRLDFALLKKSLTKHSTGLYLLPRPVKLQDNDLVNADAMHRVIGLLKATFTHVIFDISKSYTQIDMEALRAANQVLLVTQLDLPCLRNVVRLLMSFSEMEALQEKVHIVVNRAGLGNQITLKKAQETIDRKIYWQLPNDPRVMVEVRNNGIPLVEQAPKAAITQSYRMLAENLSGRGKNPDDHSLASKNKWFGFLAKK
jgi:pilus assembly protein CpaE